MPLLLGVEGFDGGDWRQGMLAVDRCQGVSMEEILHWVGRICGLKGK